MDFYKNQDQAKRRTTQLVLMFGAAIICLIAATHFFLAILMYAFSTDAAASGNFEIQSILGYFTPQQSLIITAGILIVIGLAILIRWSSLKHGGQSIAESLGGRRVNCDTNNIYERRLLNVVEEMAIASGMPVPPVYVLPEQSINAFAAGYQPSDAVIGVTEGCMTKLNREQLQGVIAHEFSHVFNGDMRLNIRLIAILYGILAIGLIGRMALEAASYSGHRRHRSDDNGGNTAMPLLVAGIGLMIIGYAGTFFGNLIKAAVSRQREFLADASAVQFTRNPQGIADALKVIGGGVGSEITHHDAEETSHLFFGEALHFNFAFFHTHPPLNERIKRIDPKWRGHFIEPNPAIEEDPLYSQFSSHQAANHEELSKPIEFTPPKPSSDFNTQNTTTALENTLEENSLNNVTNNDPVLFKLEMAARAPYSARALLFALMLDKINHNNRSKQIHYLSEIYNKALINEVERLYDLMLAADEKQLLPLVEHAAPALKQLSKNQYQVFNKTLIELAQTDHSIDLYEWCLFKMTQQYVAPSFSRVKALLPIYEKINEVEDEVRCVLSYIAYYGHSQQSDAQLAYNAGLKTLGTNTIENQLLAEKELDNFIALNNALKKLKRTYPLLKQEVLEALIASVYFDNSVQLAEDQLIRAIAAILETPLPSVFNQQ